MLVSPHSGEMDVYTSPLYRLLGKLRLCCSAVSFSAVRRCTQAAKRKCSDRAVMHRYRSPFCKLRKGTDARLCRCRLATQGVMDRRSGPTGPFARGISGWKQSFPYSGETPTPQANPGQRSCRTKNRKRCGGASPLSLQTPVGSKAFRLAGVMHDGSAAALTSNRLGRIPRQAPA